MATRQVLAVLALAALAAGCSGGAGTSATHTPTRSAGASGSPSVSATPTPGPTSPSPTPTPTLPTTKQTPGKPLKAKNGSRLGACRDGRCEVIIRPGDVLTFNRKLRMSPVRVLAIAHRHLTLDMGGAVVGFGMGGIAGTSKVELRATAFRGHRAVVYVSRA